MVILHSYVSLPEGSLLVNCPIKDWKDPPCHFCLGKYQIATDWAIESIANCNKLPEGNMVKYQDYDKFTYRTGPFVG